MKKIAILGVTGSIGKSALEIVRRDKNRYKIVFVSCHSSFKQVCTIAQEFDIKKVVITSSDFPLQRQTSWENTKFFFGSNELEKLIASQEYDILLNAVSGSAGLSYTIGGIKGGKRVALANKESLVMAGEIIGKMVSFSKAEIIPVDSEHSAIFQLIHKRRAEEIKKVFITASGGPFLHLSIGRLDKVTPSQALKHPTWQMGDKITIDSATMMNKALEVIELHHLFNIDYDDIEAVIHPQSIIHSLVELKDGNIFAQMSRPNMQMPICYALSYPKRVATQVLKTDIFDLPKLELKKVEKERFPLFYLGVEAGKRGGIFPTVLNAANEAAVKLFLEAKIGFTDIYKLVHKALDNCKQVEEPDLETIYQTNSETFSKVYFDR